MLQMAYFDRTAQPVTMDVGPVLNLEDVVGGKVCALASRAEPRDYIDTAAALEHYTVDEVIAFARRLDPGLEERDFADAGRRLDRWGDAIFAPFGLGPADVAGAAGGVRRLAAVSRISPPSPIGPGRHRHRDSPCAAGRREIS